MTNTCFDRSHHSDPLRFVGPLGDDKIFLLQDFELYGLFPYLGYPVQYLLSVGIVELLENTYEDVSVVKLVAGIVEGLDLVAFGIEVVDVTVYKTVFGPGAFAVGIYISVAVPLIGFAVHPGAPAVKPVAVDIGIVFKYSFRGEIAVFASQ